MMRLNAVIEINCLSAQIPVKEKSGVHSMCLLPELLVYGGMCGIWWYGWYMVLCVVYTVYNKFYFVTSNRSLEYAYDASANAILTITDNNVY